MELRVAQPRATRDVDLTCFTRSTSAEAYLSQIILSDLRRLVAVAGGGVNAIAAVVPAIWHPVLNAAILIS